MWKLLSSNLLMPLLRRVGTMAGASLVAYGLAQPEANAVVNGLMGAALVGVDLFTSWLDRKVRLNGLV